jgi:hypothetical protein
MLAPRATGTRYSPAPRRRWSPELRPSRPPPPPALLFLLAGVREPGELPTCLFPPDGARVAAAHSARARAPSHRGRRARLRPCLANRCSARLLLAGRLHHFNQESFEIMDELRIKSDTQKEAVKQTVAD